ncbi:MAG: 5-(carboxyamino)imidazole ribonucleotide synthase [Alphaproteobacteria bacterium]|nr:5-(carboxyamino)imidazole ribonucleotide synthase [Alphaproteobacteria bacterium]
MNAAIAPGAAIGILGGGQLGRMLAHAASRLGFDVHIYTDEPDSPAARVAARTIVADYHDHAALAAFAGDAAVVTTEFENVPADAAAALIAAGAIVHPNPRALAIAQDRLEEKRYFAANGLTPAPFAPVETIADLRAAVHAIGLPAILKTRRLGYDGRGQARLESDLGLDQALEAFAGAPLILEGFCRFEREVSIIAARNAAGEFAAYDLCENEHRGGVLARTIVPAKCDAAVQAKAVAEARRLMQALDYVGVLTIEFFLMPDGALIANEMAPRVHNSGHWTIEAALTSQFEQHIRAIAGWPLGPAARLCDAEMENLIGEDAERWAALAADPTARVHLYGKREARPGRKMGHVTRLKR